jgi:hypothetical protein
VLQQPQDQAGVKTSGPDRHHEPVERSESHGGVDRSTISDRRERGAGAGAGAEVIGDDAQAIERSIEQLRGSSRRVGVREASRRRARRHGNRICAGISCRVRARARYYADPVSMPIVDGDVLHLRRS